MQDQYKPIQNQFQSMQNPCKIHANAYKSIPNQTKSVKSIQIHIYFNIYSISSSYIAYLVPGTVPQVEHMQIDAAASQLQIDFLQTGKGQLTFLFILSITPIYPQVSLLSKNP